MMVGFKQTIKSNGSVVSAVTLISIGVAILFIGIFVEIPQHQTGYLDIGEYNFRLHYGLEGGFPKDGEKISVYGKIETRWVRGLVFDDHNNTTSVPIWNGDDTGPERFNVSGNVTKEYGQDNYVLLTTIWHGNITKIGEGRKSHLNQTWTIEHYNIPEIIILNRTISIISGLICISIGVILFALMKVKKYHHLQSLFFLFFGVLIILLGLRWGIHDESKQMLFCYIPLIAFFFFISIKIEVSKRTSKYDYLLVLLLNVIFCSGLAGVGVILLMTSKDTAQTSNGIIMIGLAIFLFVLFAVLQYINNKRGKVFEVEEISE